MSGFNRENILQLVLASFSGEMSEVPDRAAIELMTDNFLKPFPDLTADRDWLVSQAMQILITSVGEAVELVNPDDFHEWLKAHDRSAWRSWPWLRLYIKERLRRPSAVIDELDRSSDRVLELIGDPKREGLWDRRGLVVGHVQSGKTQHYTALVAKALDAGYKVVIILSGIHENLRQQTQERIEECITGKNSRDQFQPFGIREFADKYATKDARPVQLPDVNSLTSVAGDYGSAVNKIVDVAIGDVPAVFVIKKNVSILKNVLKKIRGARAPYSPLQWPTLVIDDEADHSSVNVAKIDIDTDPSRTNELIRKILWCCDKVAFVGYTATPYANIFMEDNWVKKSDVRDLDEPGSDLFPRAFIIGLEAPSNYIGPDVVFGHAGDESLGIPPQAPLPMHVPVDDADAWLPPKHKSGQAVTADLPVSLTKALRTFILSIAARIAIGQDTSHCSMLIHVTRFNAVQAQVMAQVKTYMEALYAELESGDARQAAWNELMNLWNKLFVDSFPQFEKHSSQRLDLPTLPDWPDAEQNVIAALGRIKFAMVNSETKENLDFAGNKKDGLVVVAVGGDRLSRGLTLEGLTVSYFLRGARAYDTLMQMGRWFGYRPGYAHLCRIYAPPEIVKNFKTIALATEELRREFSRMSFLNKTPSEYGLRVREPRADLLVTAMNKMRRGESVRIHFGESLISSLAIPEKALEDNFGAIRELVNSIETQKGQAVQSKKGNYHWEEVDWETLSPFFSAYTADSHTCLTIDSGKSLLQSYIESVHKHGDLKEWTVVIVSSGRGNPVFNGKPYRTVSRQRLMDAGDLEQPENPGQVAFQGVAMGADEGLDFTEEEREAAERLTEKLRSRAAAYRASRPSTRGLLLVYPIIPTAPDKHDKKIQTSQAWRDSGAPVVIGIAVSLPGSRYDTGCDYVCNRQKQREIFGSLAEDFERDEQENKDPSIV
jgi:hypothetical protein